MKQHTLTWILQLLATTVAADELSDQEGPAEPEDAGCAFYADNDGFAAKEGDRDYTGGFSMTVSGRKARDATLSLDGVRNRLNRWLKLDGLYADSSSRRHSLEVGLAVFTPGNLEDLDLQVGDRPFLTVGLITSAADRRSRPWRRRRA